MPQRLKSLNCANNQLTTLPRLPQRLTLLNCANNQLTTLPPIPASVTELHYENNHITNPIQTLSQTPIPPQTQTHPQTQPQPQTQTQTPINLCYTRLAVTPLGTSTAVIPPDVKGTNVVMMSEENVRNYLQESADNIVFKQGPNFFLHTKSAITQHIITNPSAIKYGCLAIGRSIIPRRENVNMNVPYVTGRALGLTIGVIPLSQLKTLLTMATIQAVEIVATAQQLPSTASFQMMQPNPNAVGASHCQEGQDEKVYHLLTINHMSGGGKRMYKRRRTYKRCNHSSSNKRKRTYRRCNRSSGNKRRRIYRRG